MSAATARRARWPWVLLIVALVVSALVVAVELVARAVLPGVVRGVVIEQLDLPADQQLDVDASGILLPQLIGGRIDQLHLSTDSVTLGGITGAVDITADGISLGGGDLNDAWGTVRVDAEQFTELVATSDLPIDSVEFAEPDVTVSGSLAVFGISVPIAVSLTPGADAGELLLTPVSVQVAGATLNAQQVAERFGSIAEQLTQTQRICIADQLPAGVTMTGLMVDGDEVVVDLQVDGAIVADETLQENGMCT